MSCYIKMCIENRANVRMMFKFIILDIQSFDSRVSFIKSFKRFILLICFISDLQSYSKCLTCSEQPGDWFGE